MYVYMYARLPRGHSTQGSHAYISVESQVSCVIIFMYITLCKGRTREKDKGFIGTGADLGFSEGGVRVRGGSRREELTLVLYL